MGVDKTWGHDSSVRSDADPRTTSLHDLVGWPEIRDPSIDNQDCSVAQHTESVGRFDGRIAGDQQRCSVQGRGQNVTCR
jgi:hypothetical protein